MELIIILVIFLYIMECFIQGQALNPTRKKAKENNSNLDILKTGQRRLDKRFNQNEEPPGVKIAVNSPYAEAGSEESRVDPFMQQRRKESNDVREKYEKARWVMKPILYGITADDADSFEVLFDNIDTGVLKKMDVKCTKQRENFTKRHVATLFRLIKRAQCQRKPKTNQNNKKNRRRARTRRNDAPQIINNPDGSVTTIRNCVQRGDETSLGLLRLCSQCHAVTELPPNRYV
jgi:hypothetical protein